MRYKRVAFPAVAGASSSDIHPRRLAAETRRAGEKWTFGQTWWEIEDLEEAMVGYTVYY